MHYHHAAQSPATLGNFGFGQMAPTGAGAHHFSAGRDLESFGHGFLCFDTFGASHNVLKKSAQYMNSGHCTQGVLFDDRDLRGNRRSGPF
jgi:hypothetical protein